MPPHSAPWRLSAQWPSQGKQAGAFLKKSAAKIVLTLGIGGGPVKARHASAKGKARQIPLSAKAQALMPHGYALLDDRPVQLMMKVMIKSCRIAAALVVLPSLAAAQQTVTVQKPWMRYLLPSVPAAGYLTLRNDGGADVVLTGAASPACGMLMLHKSEDSSGMAMMMEVPAVTVPAHGSVSFAPGGYHLMCMTPRMKIGQTVNITLIFKDGSKLPAALPVYGPQGAP
jgi:copper(I)-binding protein